MRVSILSVHSNELYLTDFIQIIQLLTQDNLEFVVLFEVMQLHLNLGTIIGTQALMD